MSKKRRNRHKTEHQEAQFDFDEAKELTVGEAMRKMKRWEQVYCLEILSWTSM